jgi:hypothetical protein
MILISQGGRVFKKMITIHDFFLRASGAKANANGTALQRSTGRQGTKPESPLTS